MAAVESQKIEPGSYNIPMAKWPDTATSANIDARAIADVTVKKFNSALSSKDTKAVAGLFLEESYWRDHLVNTWDFHTIKGRDNIQKFLGQNCHVKEIALDEASAFRSPHVGTFNGSSIKGVEFFVTVKTSIGRGQGVIRMAENGDRWLIWTAYFVLTELEGFEEPTKHRRPTGVSHGADTSRRNWRDKRVEAESFTTTEPVVVIVGAGQGGLAAAARLKMLNVPTLVVDTNDRVGDNWRKRYSQLVLHDPVWIDHLPYVEFPSYWPVFTPKDKLADWFESYVNTLELNVWMKTKLESSRYDDEKKQWTVNLSRTRADGTIERRVFHPAHIIQATGHSGKKNMPQIPGIDDQTFKGDLLCHSSDFPGAQPDSVGRKAIVVGACNSAHDICQDFFERGYDVTMVQRSSTLIVSSDAVMMGLKGLYDEDGPPVDDADMFLVAYPSEALKSLQYIVADIQTQHDKPTLEGLEKAGFKVDRGPDDAGLLIKYYQRGGGYYIDVGASQLIVDGKVKVKSGVEITEVTSNGLKFGDGTVLGADEIVFATGYQNMQTQAREIFGSDVHDRVDSVWGMNTEGEFRTMWQKSGHPGFWFMGGNLMLCRYMSRLLALQIKGLVEGLYTYDGNGMKTS